MKIGTKREVFAYMEFTLDFGSTSFRKFIVTGFDTEFAFIRF